MRSDLTMKLGVRADDLNGCEEENEVWVVMRPEGNQ